MLSPKMRIGARIDQLRTDTNSPGRALDAAFNYVSDAQRLCDLAQVPLRPAPVFRHARAANHFQVSDLGEI